MINVNIDGNLIKEQNVYQFNSLAKESKLLNRAIHQLEVGNDKEWYRAIADLIPNTSIYQGVGKPPITVTKAKMELLEALRKYNDQLIKIWENKKAVEEIHNDLAILKGKFLYTYRPHPIIDLDLTTEKPTVDWPQPNPDKLITKFPSYIVKNLHPLGSHELELTIIFHYQKILKVIEKNILSEYLVRKLSIEGLKQILIMCYEMLSDKDITTEETNFYRKDNVFCYRDRKKKFIKKYAEKAEKKGAHEDAAALYEIADRKLAFHEYGPHHWNAFHNQVGYAAPTFDEVPGYIDQFLNLLYKHLRKKPPFHPYLIAKFIHNGITAIHPTSDCNGRTARLYMNIYLMQQGLKPFHPLADKEYMTHTAKPDSFASYLHQTIQFLETKIENVEETPRYDCQQM